MRLTGAIHIGPLHHLPEWQAAGQQQPPLAASARPQHLVPSQCLFPSAEKLGTESKERMSLGSKQIVKREENVRGQSNLHLVGVPACSSGGRGIGKGDNWTARVWGDIPYSPSFFPP